MNIKVRKFWVKLLVPLLVFVAIELTREKLFLLSFNQQYPAHMQRIYILSFREIQSQAVTASRIVSAWFSSKSVGTVFSSLQLHIYV